MLVVSLLAMSQTLRSHSSTCDSEIRTITGHARNSFRAQVLLKPVFHLGLIDLVAREGEYSERSESLLNNRPVVLWVCTWHLHVALFIPWPFFVPEGKPPTSNLSLRQNVWLRPSSRGRVVAEPMLSRGRRILQQRTLRASPSSTHTGGCKRGASSILGAHQGAANSPVSDRRHDDSRSYTLSEPRETPPVALSHEIRLGGKHPPTYTFQSLPIIPAHPIPTSEGHDGAAPSREGEHPCLGPITITPAWGHSVHSQARLRTVHLSALPTAGWHYSIVFLLPYSVLCGAVLPGVGSHFTHGRELY
ncbi:hypothetical protein PAPYR_8838 [Paratrimastix pyriformis]|uniref:Uncharacterized protein n=1 Tax=Paratrimastix pyriformis TaxID=342808 RepID=A0ABQ8U9S8_9EUKA|nr:hypothetical protein PAPYR_8838 [Paratrimastix pyriformis]